MNEVNKSDPSKLMKGKIERGGQDSLEILKREGSAQMIS